MILPAGNRKSRRRPPAGPAPDGLRLHLPGRKPPAWRDLLIAFAALGATVLAFMTGGHLAGRNPDAEDEVRIEEAPPPPPPPPPKEIKEPPKPTPPPREKTPPPPAPPPPPQFGLEKEATSGSGDLAVATGNTLMRKSDSLVRPAPPPPPPEPTRLDQEPQAIDKVVPKYPEWAEDQGVTSRVLVMVTIDADGKVIDARVQASGGQDFDKASIAAAKATHYRPYVEKGRALPARFVVTYEFVLQ